MILRKATGLGKQTIGGTSLRSEYPRSLATIDID